MVAVRLQTITGRSHCLELDCNVQVDLLYQTAASALQQPADKFSLVLRGNAITHPAAADSSQASARSGLSQRSVQLRDGDVLLVAPVRAKPSARLQRAAAAISGVTPAEPDEDEEALRFVLPENAPAWERLLAHLLQQRLHLPELALVWLWTIGPHRVAVAAAVLAGAKVASAFDLGPVYLLVAMLVTIFTHLGQRREGDASAYSIFNAGVQRLPGQLDADVIDQQIRQGQMM